MNIKPFGRNILIKPAERKTVLVSDQGGSLCEYGTVLAIGDAVVNFKVGDNLGFVVWGIQKLDIDGKIFYFIPENDDFILGILHE